MTEEQRARKNAKSKIWYRTVGKQRSKESYWRRRKSILEANRQRDYGISPEAFAAMVAAQDNRCALCLGPPNGRWRTLVIDHDHQTGKVRGLLCNKCNVGLGALGDSVDALMRAVAYLRGDGNSDGPDAL